MNIYGYNTFTDCYAAAHDVVGKPKGQKFRVAKRKTDINPQRTSKRIEIGEIPIK